MLAAQRNLRVTDGLLQVNRQALGIVQERVKQGAAPALEENLALVEVNRLDASQKLLASRVEVATLQLKALAGMTPDAPLSLRGDLSATVATADRGEAVARALAGRADLEAARADAAASRARILKEQAEGRWDASVNLGYMRQDFGFDLMGSTAQGQTRPREIYERGVRDIARRNLDVVRQSYELGRGSLLDVVAEQRRYIETENGYTDALKQVYDAAVEIERTVGARGR